MSEEEENPERNPDHLEEDDNVPDISYDEEDE